MLNQTKISVKDLQLGMYVAKLDRPWVDTPFSFQGIKINCSNDIEELQQNCIYVYIDVEKSTLQVRNKFTSFGHSIANVKYKPKSRKVNNRDTNNQESTEHTEIIVPTADRQFQHHMQRALEIHGAAHDHIKSVMTDVHNGESVDVSHAKNIVNQLAVNVIKNPTALMWLTQLKNRDEYTAIHSLNVCILSLCFGRYMGLNQSQLSDLGLGAMLHDIGKLKIPLDVLNKPGRLTGEEYKIVKQHTVFGYELLKNKNGLSSSILNTIKHHHERIDGKGYPSLIGGEEIGYHTRMVSIVDAYDAITSKRSYKEAASSHRAVNFLYDKSGTNFDNDLVSQFIKYMGIYPIGSIVELNTGQVGVVVADNKLNQLLPVILLLLDEDKQAYQMSKYINLASSTWINMEARPYIDRIVDPDSYGLDIPMIMRTESKILGHTKI